MPREEEYQEVKRHGLFPSLLNLFPETIKRLWIGNIIQRTLSMLTIWTGTQQIPVRGTIDGAVRVSITGAPYTTYLSANGNTTNNYPATPQLSSSLVPSKWYIGIQDAEVYICFRNQEDTAWLSDMFLSPGYHTIEFASTAICLRSVGLDNPGSFEVTAFM